MSLEPFLSNKWHWAVLTKPTANWSKTLALFAFAGKKYDHMPLISAIPMKVDTGDEIMPLKLLNGILPSRDEPLAMIQGDGEIEDIEFTFETCGEPCPVYEGPDCSVDAFCYLAGYNAFSGRQYDNPICYCQYAAVSFSRHTGKLDKHFITWWPFCSFWWLAQ